MNQKPKVLIIGAGPTGLTVGLVLSRYNIPFRIIDKKAHATETSNALGIHARTLELLRDLGIVEDFLQQGKRINAACVHIDEQHVAKVDLSKIDSTYNFVILLPQSGTEKILVTHLQNQGIEVEYNTELTQLTDNIATVVSNNQQQTIEADYIVACDGTHSTVRKLTGMEFSGEEFPQQFVLADTTIKTDLPLDKLHTFVGSNEIFAVFPLPSGEVRLVANLSDIKKVKLEKVNFDNIAKKRSFNHIKIDRISWKSTFWIHSNRIAAMRKGNIFFCGDSAHTHSPFGGQGMNTGMQDAYNLGWKLAFVIQGKAPSFLLQSYNEERHRVAEELVKDTAAITKRLVSKNPVIKFTKKHIIPFLLNNPSLNQKLANRMAMLTIHYPKSSAIESKSVISNRSPQPGDLAPEIKSLEPHPFTHYLSGDKYWLLIFCGKKIAPQQLERIHSLCEMLDTEYSETLFYRIVSKKPVKLPYAQLIDDDFTIHQTFNVEYPALCLVRPDKYIAYASGFLNMKGLQSYLESAFIAQQ